MLRKDPYNYEVSDEEMNRMIYVGKEQIDDDTRRKYCRIFSRIKRDNREHINPIPDWCMIDLEELMTSFKNYCEFCKEMNNTNREECVKHRYLFLSFGLENPEAHLNVNDDEVYQVVKKAKEDKEDKKSQSRVDQSVRKAIDDIIKKYLYEFLVPELKYTEEGLLEVDINDIPITFIKPYIHSFEMINKFKGRSIGYLENYIQSEKIDEKLKEEYEKALKEYKEHRAEVIAKFSSLLVGNTENTKLAEGQLSELRTLTGELTIQGVRNQNKSNILSIPTGGIGEVDE